MGRGTDGSSRRLSDMRNHERGPREMGSESTRWEKGWESTRMEKGWESTEMEKGWESPGMEKELKGC